MNVDFRMSEDLIPITPPSEDEYLNTLGEYVVNKVPLHRRQPTKGALRYINAKDVIAEKVEWLWYPYIPLGKLTMLEGDPGKGKSWLSAWMASALSQGWQMPGQDRPQPPMNTLLLSGEDGIADTIKPRLEQMGANMNRVYMSDEMFLLDKAGIGKLELAIQDTKAKVVFMDPLVAYMGGKVDMHKANEVRELVGALSQMALRQGTAIVAVRHLRKESGGKDIYRGIGSIDFTAAARSALLIDEDGLGHMVRHIKSNLAPMGRGIYYKIEDGRFTWGDFVDPEYAKKPSKAVSKVPLALTRAQELLHDLLRDGPQPVPYVLEVARTLGISPRTMERAKEGVARSQKVGQLWTWALVEREDMGEMGAHSLQIKQIDPKIAELVLQAKAKMGLNVSSAGELPPSGGF